MKTLYKITITAITLTALPACSPKVGSEEWCTDMKQKEKADWPGNEVTTFAKNCVFK